MNASAEREIHQVIQQWMSAVKAKDLERIASLYADDVVAFDAINTLQFKGKPTYIKHWQDCFEYCPGPMVFEMEQWQVHATDELGVAHWLNICGAGEGEGAYMRATMAFKRIDGQWKVVHDHWSAPFDMQTQKALFDLKP